jgi:ArsR family transcriptional regulator
MRKLARQFKALSEEMRLQILALLFRHGEMCVCEVERLLGVSQSKASRHLRYLLHSGLGADRRDGPWIFYRIAAAESEAQRLLLETLRTLLADADVPDVTAELERMRADRRSDAVECRRATERGEDPAGPRTRAVRDEKILR